MNHFVISSLLNVVSTLGMALFIFLRKEKSESTAIWGWLCIGASLWGAGSLIHSLSSQSPQWALFGWQVANTGAITAPLWYTHFVFRYLQKPQRLLLPFLYLLAGFFLYLTWFVPGQMIGGLHLVFGQFYYTQFQWDVNPYYPTFYFIFDWLMLTYAFLYLFVALFSATGVRRNQIKYLIVGSLVGWAGGHGDWVTVFFPQVYPYANYLIGVYPLIIGYAIVRHHLMDINLVFKKSLVYSILITMTTAFYILSVITSERLFQNILGYQDILGSFFITLVIAVLFTPLKNNIQTFVDKTVFKRTAVEMAKENERLRREVQQSERYKTIASLTNDIVNEIKTPLTVLKTYGALSFLKFKDKESLSRFARRYMREVNKINDLLESLMEYSNPEPLATQNIEVLNLLNETIGQLKGRLTAQKIQIKQELKTQDVRLRLDPSQFRQALGNIIMNAIEAMPDGGRLWVGTEQTSETLKIIVRDSGRGLAADDLSRIFDPFFSQKKEHVGLGLSITQGIIENHGGKIRVRSEVDLGTEFVIELPLELFIILGTSILGYQDVNAHALCVAP